MPVLLHYDLASGFTPSTSAYGVSGGALTNGSLSSFVNSTAGYTSDAILIANPPDSTTTKTLAVTNNAYFSFVATPATGKKISLTSLKFNIARGGASTPRGYAVRSSIDGYASDLATADVATQRTTWTAVTVDLSGASFQNLTSAITFRVYLYAPSSGTSLDIDDVQINGSVYLVGNRGRIWKVGYYPVYSQAAVPPSSINWNAYTHINYFAIAPVSTGAINEDFQGSISTLKSAIVTAAHAAGKSICICVGGAGVADSAWDGATNANQATFVTNLVNYVAANNFDGIDLDWEPDPGDNLSTVYGTQYQSFVAALRAALPVGKLLTVATPGSSSVLGTMFNSLKGYFDQINIMTYDMNYGLTKQGWHHTALYSGGQWTDGAPMPSADQRVLTMVNAGISPTKLGIGLAFYAHVMTGPNALYSTTAASARTTPDYDGLDTSGDTFDSDGQARYKTDATHFTTYDDPVSVAAKVTYIYNQGLGGFCVWNVAAENKNSHDLSNAIVAADTEAADPNMGRSVLSTKVRLQIFY